MQMKSTTEQAGNDDLSRFAIAAGKSNQKEYEMVHEEVDVQKENVEEEESIKSVQAEQPVERA